MKPWIKRIFTEPASKRFRITYTVVSSLPVIYIWLMMIPGLVEMDSDRAATLVAEVSVKSLIYLLGINYFIWRDYKSRSDKVRQD